MWFSKFIGQDDRTNIGGNHPEYMYRYPGYFFPRRNTQWNLDHKKCANQCNRLYIIKCTGKHPFIYAHINRMFYSYLYYRGLYRYKAFCSVSGNSGFITDGWDKRIMWHKAARYSTSPGCCRIYCRICRTTSRGHTEYLWNACCGQRHVEQHQRMLDHQGKVQDVQQL